MHQVCSSRYVILTKGQAIREGNAFQLGAHVDNLYFALFVYPLSTPPILLTTVAHR